MRGKINEKKYTPKEYVMEEGEKVNLGVKAVSVNEKDRKTSMLRRV